LKSSSQGDETPELFASFAVLYEVRGARKSVAVDLHVWDMQKEFTTDLLM
jgi:hypothetical protein